MAAPAVLQPLLDGLEPLTPPDSVDDVPELPASSLRKDTGAYYTPEAVVSTLIRWVVRADTDRLLDPSCGDGRFVACHPNSVGIERDVRAATTAKRRAPLARIYRSDFFAWATDTDERFECAAGNPPFIRYQTFNGQVRARALHLCRSLGAPFSGLTSSWAPFLVATASLLKRGGRLAFVVPAEIGHAPYAAPLLEFLASHFDVVQVIAIRDKLFPKLSEDCWLLYADGFGGVTSEVRFTFVEQFIPSPRPPGNGTRIALNEWRSGWNCRLRPFLLSSDARSLYQHALGHPGSRRLGMMASVGIGYVSGANDFFHLRPSEAARWQIPASFLHPSVRKSRMLPPRRLTRNSIDRWHRLDEPMLLLRIRKSDTVPKSVQRYLDTEAGQRARTTYKCRTRHPWYSVPDVRIPDFFLTYMSGRAPHLVRNSSAASCTNTVHAVHVHEKSLLRRLTRIWETSFVRLSCEIEGHPLGGGMLKLEPREAARVLLPDASLLPMLSGTEVEDSLATLRTWRHYAIGK